MCIFSNLFIIGPFLKGDSPSPGKNIIKGKVKSFSDGASYRNHFVCMCFIKKSWYLLGIGLVQEQVGQWVPSSTCLSARFQPKFTLSHIQVSQ